MSIHGATSVPDGYLSLGLSIGGQSFLVSGRPEAIVLVAQALAPRLAEIGYSRVPRYDERLHGTGTFDTGRGFVTGPRPAVDIIRNVMTNLV